MSGIDLPSTYGAMLIGTFFATFFQGLLSLQAYIYYESFPDDSCWLKSLVGGVWLLDLTHLILICKSCYHYLIDHWGDDAALLQSTEELNLHLVFIGAPIILCQGFFIRRVWALSQRNWLLVGTLSAMCMSTLLLDILLAIQMTRSPSVAKFSSGSGETLAMFSIGAATDFVIAVLLCWYLQRGRTTFGRTNFILNRIIQYTVATGLATSLLAIGCVAAYLIKPNSFIFIAMDFSLGRMYTNALLATLNSRRDLRAALDASWTPPKSASLLVFDMTSQPAQDCALKEIGDKSRVSLGNDH